MSRNLTIPDIYTPLPMAYRDLNQDFWMKIYLGRKQRVIDFRDYAIDESKASMSDLLLNNLESKVLLVSGQNVGHLTDTREIRLRPDTDAQRWRRFEFPISQARQRRAGEMIEYAFKLPADFPHYLSTSVFTRDYNSWQLKCARKTLRPVQGMLSDPYTFDVQNVRDGWLMLLLPAHQSLEAQNVELKVKLPDYISDVWRNEPDHLGMTFNAPHEGWMVLHYPYDSKWRLSVDDKPAQLYRVNQYFMGTPISQGQHQILLSYWPGSPLRWLLFLSMILTVVVFEGLVIYAFRQKF